MLNFLILTLTTLFSINLVGENENSILETLTNGVILNIQKTENHPEKLFLQVFEGKRPVFESDLSYTNKESIAFALGNYCEYINHNVFPENLTVSLIGDIDIEWSKAVLHRHFGQLKSPSRLVYERGDGEFPIIRASDAFNGASPELFFQLPITHIEEKIIYKIITTMADKNIFELLLEKKDLDKKGKRINHVHPLRFLGAIFANPDLKKAMKEVKKNGFKWDGFLDGLSRRMNEEASHNNIIQYIPGFAQHVGVEPRRVLIYAQNKDWDGLTKYLTAH